jgi:hypothetical protein
VVIRIGVDLDPDADIEIDTHFDTDTVSRAFSVSSSNRRDRPADGAEVVVSRLPLRYRPALIAVQCSRHWL